MLKDFSEKELQMFREIGVEEVILKSLRPTKVYEIAVEKAFIDAASGFAVNSLRRCFVAMSKFNLHRYTPEFDELIKL